MRPKVNIKSNFSKTIVERVFDESVFILRNRATLKFTSRRFGVSITTVWRDMRERLPYINWEQYWKVNNLINPKYVFGGKNYDEGRRGSG